MSKAPGEALRALVVSEMVTMLKRFAIMYAQPGRHVIDPDVMSQVETHPGRFDLGVELGNAMLEALGYDIGEPAEPRFDKTKRAAAKKAAKPPKGMNAKERAEWEASQAQATS